MLRKCSAVTLCCALLLAVARPALADTPAKPTDDKARAERIRAAAHKLIADARDEAARPYDGAQSKYPPQANHLSKGTKVAIGVTVAVAVIVAIVIATKANNGPSGHVALF